MRRVSPTFFAIMLLLAFLLFNAICVVIFGWMISVTNCLIVWGVFSVLYGVEWGARKYYMGGETQMLTPPAQPAYGRHGR